MARMTGPDCAVMCNYASPSLQTGGGACEHPTAPFAGPDVCTRTSYRRDGKERAGSGAGSESGAGAGSETRTRSVVGTGT